MQEPIAVTSPGPSPAPLSLQLVEHWEWTRALARRMVRDPNDADDAAQEAWLLARRSGAGRGGRAMHAGFLGTVLRNVVRSGARAHRHMAARQGEVVLQRTVHGDEAPSPGDLVAAAETGRALCAAVMELPDVYRDVILQRYFQGLSNGEIARRGGVPEGTVRSRLKRGLDQLRERLDDGHEGRSTKSLALLAALPVGKGSIAGAPGVDVFGRGAKAAAWGDGHGVLLALGLAAMVAAVVSIFAQGDATAATPEAPPFAAPVNQMASLAPLDPAGAAPARRVSATVAEPKQEERVRLFEVSGTVVDVDRKPLVGAEVTLRGSAFHEGGFLEGVLRVKTDASGAFHLQPSLRDGGSGMLIVNAGPLFGSRVFRFGGPGVGIHRQPREGRRPLGEILMSPRGQVVTRLVDKAGKPIANVQVLLSPVAGGSGFAVNSGADGRAVFDGMRKGEFEMRAMDPAYGRETLARFFIEPGQPVEVGDIVLEEAPDGVEEDFEVMDHNEGDVAGPDGPQPVVRGHVLRRGQPVSGLDVTATPLFGGDPYMKSVPLAGVPVDQWLDRLEHFRTVRTQVARAVTDGSGRFVLRGLRPGRAYRVVAWGADDHAVLQPVVLDPVAERVAEAAEDSEEDPAEIATLLGALELKPYASVELQVSGAEGIDRTEFEVVRRELDDLHLEGADASGAIRLERVIAGPQVLWLEPIAGRFSRHCRVAFHARPGEALGLEVDAGPYELTPVRILLSGIAGPSPGYRAMLRSVEDGPLKWASEALDPPASTSTSLRAKPGTWSAQAQTRALGAAVLDVWIRGRRIRVPFPNVGAGEPMDVEVPIPIGADLRVELPESVEFLGEGVVEFLGPNTSWSANIVDGEIVDLPWGVESPGLAVLIVGQLSPGEGTFSIRVRDTEPRDGGLGIVVFQKSSQQMLEKGQVPVWSLR